MNDESASHALVRAGDSPPPALTAEQVQQRRADYNRLVRTTRLANLVLERVDFKISPEALGIKTSLLNRNIGATTKVMAYGHDDGTCMANVIWEVILKFKTKTVVKCNASYIVSYEGVKDCSDEVIELFLEHVGKVATYAYFRALYANLDWSATLNSQPLPVLQLQPKI
ncbi:hypothetical protein [Bradyrhizobium sp. SSUT77]|uniref:hypothetical protein n=1 Tax=Bradyrhizobium sp. SSUT77 TaxID=3040603 RepID=UPI002447EF54|nr:hypothetical protein [Bradyrhizobium sp. SSUT77]MDH2345520.1 hypothetical protein [Bradyrhizobium sp. SSUT77]